MSLKRFAVKSTISESAYNASVSGSNNMGAGVHEGVVLSSVTGSTDEDKYHFYDLIWENVEGATFKERNFVTWEVKDEKGNLTGERQISDNFIKLGMTLSGNDHEINKKFFLDAENGAYLNEELMQAAIGTKATIVIGLPKKGNTSRNYDDKPCIVDIATGELLEDVGGPYESWEDLKDAAKENGIKLAYNRVKFHKGFKDAASTNRQQLLDALEATSSTQSSGTSGSGQVQGF